MTARQSADMLHGDADEGLDGSDRDRRGTGEVELDWMEGQLGHGYDLTEPDMVTQRKWRG
ncbi:MAG TPA: hypothetical protein VML36_01005 [Nitrospiria bacterium]|nr:hypothetical protein [Nitrospiria bacterium]